MSQDVRPAHAGVLEDEMLALNLQREEIIDREGTKKGKYTLNNVPDLEIAFTDYLAEIEVRLQFFDDFRLAHSIANAVDSDAEAIAELSQAETRAEEDRQVAVRLSDGDPDLQVSPPHQEAAHESFMAKEVSHLADLLSNEELDDSATAVAGPSAPYARRQADAFGKLARKTFQCVACTDSFRWTDVSQLPCGHEYCKTCLREFIMRGIIDRDLTLIPPRCCGKPLAHDIIVNTLNEEDMEDFQYGTIERSTKDKTYCSNAECGKFIAPVHTAAGTATCPRCESKTCTLCKTASHKDDCPSDTALQATLELGTENRWQRCFSCRSLVAIEWGCNHMTCRCGAEFCYGCGVEWADPRNCRCEFWIEENLVHRARQLVDREAPLNILSAERHRRIAEVQEQLRYTDECDHQGRRKFQRIDGGRRSNFQCEMCNVRHRKFILRCRQCQLELCVECRLHRV